MANLAGDLGKTIAGSIGKSLSGFTAGLKGAAISGNPAVFGPALANLSKMMKSDQTQRQRDRAFEEEKTLEQRKLFTDILGEQKKTNQTLADILKALLGQGKEEENSFIKFIRELGKLIAGAIAHGLDKIVKLLRGFLDAIQTKFKDILERFRKALRFIEDLFGRLGNAVKWLAGMIENMGRAIGKFLKFLSDALGDFLKFLRRKFPFIDEIFKYFEDVAKAIASFFGKIIDFFKNLPGRIFEFLKRIPEEIGAIFRRAFNFIRNIPDEIAARFKGMFDRFKKLPFVDDILRFFSETIPSRLNDLVARFRALPFVDDIIRIFGETIPTKFSALSDAIRSISFDDIVRFFSELPSKIRLPNFDDIVKAIDGIFNMLPESEGLRRLRNTTLVNFAVLADIMDGVKADLSMKFEGFKTSFTDFATRAKDFYGRTLAAFQDGRLALSVDDLGKIMPEILGKSGGVFQEIAARLGYVYQVITEGLGKAMTAVDDAVKFIKDLPIWKTLGDIGAKILKWLWPIDLILSIFDGLSLATNEEKLGQYLNKAEIEVSFMDRVSGFLGGAVSSFIGGFIDVVVKLVDWVWSNTFGEGKTWAQSTDLGMQTLFDEYFTKIIDNFFGYWKELFNLVKSIFTLDGEGISNAFSELGMIFEDMAVSIMNLGIEIAEKIGIRKWFIEMGNTIGSWWNDLSNSIGEGWFNAKKFVFGVVGKAIDATINAIGPAIVGMFNAISRGVNSIVGWVVDKVATLVGYVSPDTAKKITEFGKTLQLQETKFETYQSGMTKEAEKMAKEGYKKTTFTPTDSTFDKSTSLFVSRKEVRDRERASEVTRETRRSKGVTNAPAPVTPPTTSATLPSQSASYTPTSTNNQPVSVRNNNPGNLRYYARYAGPGGVLEGAVPGAEGSFAVFPTPEMGMAAMQKQIQLDTQSRGMTLDQFISKYAPRRDNNDTAAYVANMSRSLGIGPNDRIPPQLIPQLQQAMIRQEGGAAASNYYAGVQPGAGGFAFRPPSLMTVGMPGGYGYSGGGGNINIPSFASGIPNATFGQGPFQGNFSGTITGPEATYIANRTKIEQGVIDSIEGRRPNTTAYTGQDADTRLIGLNSEANEMESQNLVYQQQLVTGVQQLNDQYKEQRKNLEMQFLGQIQNDISRSIYKALGPAGIGVTGQQNSAFGAINQLYSGAFNNFATKILGKEMGPIYGNIFSQLAASYTDQFVNQVLGPMFGPNAAQGFNRAINNYAQGATVRKQYDVLKSDYNKMESDFKQLSSQVTLVDRLNALSPLTGKPSQDKLNLIGQIDAMEKALAQKGIQLGEAKKAKDASNKMVYEDLIFAMTGIPTGMRSMLGYEQGIQNFSQQMAMMIGQPFSGLFGNSGGYEEYQRNVERQMRLGVDAQGRAMEQGALQVRDGMVYAGDYHNQGFGQVTNAHLMGYAQVTQMGLQGQAQVLQQHAMMLQNMQFGGGGGGQSFLGMLFDKGVDLLAGKFFGGGGASSTVNPADFPAYDDDGNLMPGYGINQETGQTYWNPYSGGNAPASFVSGGVPGATTAQTTGFFDTISQGFKDVSQSVGNFFSDLFKPSQTTPVGAGGTVPGYTGPGQPAARPGFSFGDMLAGFGGQYIGGKIGQKIGVSNSFGGMIVQAGINQTVGTVLGNIMKGQSLTTGLSNIPGALSGIAQGMFSPQIGIGNMISKFAGSNFMTNLSPGLAGSLGQFGTAFANPAIFGNSMAGGTLGQLPASQLLGSLGGAALGGFSAYNMSKMLSGGYDVGGGALNKLAGIGTAAALLNIGGMSTAFAATGLGSALSGAAGLVGMGPLGLAILGVAVLGNRLFGRKAPEVRGQGITGTLAEGDSTSLQNYTDMFQKGGKFRSDRSWTDYSAADPELIKYMQSAVNNTFAGVREGAKIMGIDPNAVTGFTQAIKLNMQGMSQQQQAETLMNALKGFSNAMLTQAYPALSQFTLEGEQLYETFGRLTQSTTLVNDTFDMLKFNIDALSQIGGKTGLELADLKYDIISAFGGKDFQEQTDNYNKAVGEFFNLFYSPEEKLTYSLKQTKAAFDKIEEEIKNKITIPGLTIDIPEFKGTVEESAKAYRDFVKNFAETTGLQTDAQRETYRMLLEAGPMYYQGAQQFVELNKIQEAEKKKSPAEMAAEYAAAGASIIGSSAFETPGSLGAGIFTGEFANTLNTAAGSMDYIATSFAGGPETMEPAPGTKVVDPVTGREFEVGGIYDMSMDTTMAYHRAIQAWKSERMGTGATTQIGSGSAQYLNEQGQMINGSYGGGGSTNVSTVVDNSVRQVSSPVTTFVMNDDKVRDFHPILRNTERTSLRAYTLAMR